MKILIYPEAYMANFGFLWIVLVTILKGCKAFFSIWDDLFIYIYILLHEGFYFQWSPSIVYLSFHYLFTLTFSDNFVFGPNFTNVVKIFQEFDRSPTVNTGKVNLTRFSETFGVFSSLFVTFCFWTTSVSNLGHKSKPFWVLDLNKWASEGEAAQKGDFRSNFGLPGYPQVFRWGRSYI